MYGLEAIAHYNGWAQAIIGATIVMAGLGALSFAISQIHVLAEFFEKRQKSSKTGPPPGLAALHPKEPSPADLDQTIRKYQELVARLASPFTLQELYGACRKHGFRHPHQSIKMLREAGILQPKGDGAFIWQPDDESRTTKN